jgi:hypothetical protein
MSGPKTIIYPRNICDAIRGSYPDKFLSSTLQCKRLDDTDKAYKQ